MNFSVLPPEINSLRMFAGAGPGPMLSAAAAWDGLAAELQGAASSFSSVTADLAGAAWQGPASTAMAAAAAPYAGWLSVAATQAAGAAGQARAMVSAFEAAQAATVQPLLVALNRNAFVRMVLTNWFGQNCPAIAGAEAEYEQMWAQDVSAMAGYHGCASAVAARLTPFQRMLQSLPGQVSASVPAAAPAGPDIALSMFGTTLFQSGTAHATSGFGGVALAVGANSNATANTTMLTPGLGSFATAIGNNNTAVANGTLCTATVVGNNSNATGGFGGIGSTAFVTGDHSGASAGFSNRDFGNLAAVSGNYSSALAGSGSGNAAVAFGNENTVRAGGNPGIAGAPGSNLNFGFAQGTGNEVSAGTLNPSSSNANVAGVLLANHAFASSGDGNANIATVLSGTGGSAHAANGNANLATVVAGTGCSAHAGSGNLNAAGVSGLLPFTNNLTSSATGGFASSFKFLPPALDPFGP
ncbi:hypothetical protein B1987_27830 [Mycobacterium kansasii]|uniref:Putative PPE family protein PPE42 n=1 Tax=Mycobacterium attenuatum TaxID=2341086 RepID=A0A498Q1I8_9MYCO|nr:PPE family protein [Mycobacterium attenuatum]ORB86946.1 hypothetical protein B1987_27830 [Mycobacterium kansasii]VBA38453.1 putative PPE family protein PPE42 [Mycobacterium attenuatum]VBA52504.1 putative PPE family protein PPE42 [Mycobacterium attenuatum]VBA57634.1 putative PPE family protein PPE42 [Mycobacterium attenuatum]